MKLGARVKEQIARTIGKFFTTNEILTIFTDANISADRELYAKWHITLDAFSKTSSVDAIFGIIEEFCHPLNFKQNPPRREEFITALNTVLAYDDLEIQSTDRTAKVCPIGSEDFHRDVDVPKENKPATTTPSPKEVEEIFDDLELYDNDTEIPTEDDVKEQEDIKKIIANKEIVRQLREYHQTLIDVIETFCQNLKKPTKELNDAYLFLARKTQDIASSLGLRYYALKLYRPFKNIYSAEIEWNGAGDSIDLRLNPKLSWDAVRPSLYNAHSDIVKICTIAEEDSEMTDDQKKLEEIAGLVAKARTKKSFEPQLKKEQPLEVRLVHGSQIAIEKPGEETRHKFPHKLPRGTKWENITIKFIDDDRVHILVQGKSHAAHYSEMGLEGKGGKPSVLWIFLRVLAMYAGEIKATDPKAVDTYKKQKQSLSNALEAYFGIDFDPFYPFQMKGKTNKTYRVKFALLPPDEGFSFEKKEKSRLLEKLVKPDPFADLGSYMRDIAPMVAQTEIVPEKER